MKSFYKSIFVFVLLVKPCGLFAQQLAVGPSFSYDFINKGYEDKVLGFTTGANLFIDLKKHFSFETGLRYSLKKYKSEYVYHPFFEFESPPPWLHPYNSIKIFKSFIIPISLSCNILNTSFYTIYLAMGTSFQFRLNEYEYGTAYKVLDTNLTVDKGPFDYGYTLISSDENKLKFNHINLEPSAGVELTLSDHIKTGIEFQRIITLTSNEWYRHDYSSLALFAKYYFDEIKRPEK